MAEPVIIGTDVKFVKNATTLGKTISCYQNGGANSYIGCEYEGSNYQVPAGKHFVITKAYMYTHDNLSRTVSIFEHTVVSTAGGQEKLKLPYATIASDATFYFDLDVYVDIASGNFVNIFHEGIGSPVTVILNGVELDN